MAKAKEALESKALDPVADFDTPVRREPASEDEPGAPQVVQNGMALMQFVRVKPTREKDGKRFLMLELSVGLTEESAPLFGKEVEDRYALLRDDAGVTRIDVTDVPLHTIDIAIAADLKPVVHVACIPEAVRLQAVEEKGSGEERTVIRLSFTAPVPQTNDLALWACNNHGELVWVAMGETQGRLVR